MVVLEPDAEVGVDRGLGCGVGLLTYLLDVTITRQGSTDNLATVKYRRVWDIDATSELTSYGTLVRSTSDPEVTSLSDNGVAYPDPDMSDVANNAGICGDPCSYTWRHAPQTDYAGSDAEGAAMTLQADLYPG